MPPISDDVTIARSAVYLTRGSSNVIGVERLRRVDDRLATSAN